MIGSGDDSSWGRKSPLDGSLRESLLTAVSGSLFTRRPWVRQSRSFSAELLHRLETAGRIHSDLVQGLVFHRHHPLCVEWLEEPFIESPPSRLRQLPRVTAEKMFLQTFALYRVAHCMSLNVIDFSRFQLDEENGVLRFPILLEPGLTGPSPEDMLRLFSENTVLGPLNRREACVLFENLTRQTVRGDEYFYCYDEFASAFIQLSSGDNWENGGVFRIRIHVNDTVQRDIVRFQICRRLIRSGVYIVQKQERSMTPFPEKTGERDFELHSGEEADELRRRFFYFIKKTGRRAVAFFFDPLTGEDRLFMECLLAAPREAVVFAVVFSVEEGCCLSFDLELKENPVNRLDGSLLPGSRQNGPTPENIALVFNPLATELASWRREDEPESDARILGQAHEYLLQKDYENLGKTLSKLNDPIPPPVREEYNFLQCLRFETSDPGLADEYHQKLKSPLFRRLAQVKRINRAIYGGELAFAAQTLREAHLFLEKRGYAREALEAQSLLAKVYREKLDRREAQRLYNILYSACEQKGFSLLAADVALDFGNLFFMANDFFSAENWYRKAEKNYKISENLNGAVLVLSNLVEIEKIRGDWPLAEKHLRITLASSEKRRLIVASGVDYFNLAHLEYLRHNIEPAREFLERAASFFREKKYLSGLAQCGLLFWRLEFHRCGGQPLPESIRTTPWRRELEMMYDRLGELDRLLVDLFRMAEASPLDDEKARLIYSHIISLPDLQLAFDTLILLAPLLPIPELPDFLRQLADRLSAGAKNYFYYEFHYYFFHWLLPEKKITSELKETFLDVCHFFRKGGRRLSPVMNLLKIALDEADALIDTNKSLGKPGGDSNRNSPEDIFNNLRNRINEVFPDPPQFLRVTIYERNTETPFLDCSSDLGSNLSSLHNADSGVSLNSGGGTWPGFCDLSGLIMKRAASGAESAELLAEDIRSRYQPASHTPLPPLVKVSLWRISGDLFAVLLAAFPNLNLQGQDWLKMYDPLFREFAGSIHEYHEKVHAANRRLDWIIGRSPAIRKLRGQLEQLARVEFSVLILGESGSGKELAARAIHRLSSRSQHPFVAVNAAAIPENLLEAELFGFKKGAFTGAHEDKIGLIQTAHLGVLFLDEIADLPLLLQAKLLRVLQENEIRRIGENRSTPVNFRLLSATNKNLDQLIRENKFREDLFYRIQDLTLHVPSLRERDGDIPLLVRHFLEKYRFSIPDGLEFTRLISCFESRTWPGNVRELEAAVKRMITFYPDLYAAGLWTPQKTGNALRDSDPADLNGGLNAARDQFEKNLVRHALTEHRGNRRQAAASLKISRQHLFKLIQKYQITDSQLIFSN